MLKFKCTGCHLFFENEGMKKEYNSAIYGPCFKYIAICPSCNNETDEYRSQLPKKSSINYSIPNNSCEGCCCNRN
jgi:hypothetical protein